MLSGRILKVSLAIALGGLALVVAFQRIDASLTERKFLKEFDEITLISSHEGFAWQDYVLSVHRDGRVIFDAGPDTLLPGRHELSMPKERVEPLFEQFANSSFTRMKPLYKGLLKPTDRTTICLNGGALKDCVESASSPQFGNDAPDEFGELAGAILQTAPVDRWMRIDAKTIDVFREEGLDPRSIGGEHVVFQTAQYLSPEMMRALIAAGFPIDAVRHDPDYGLSTPVEVAAFFGHADMVRDLISAGAWKGKSRALPQATLRAAAESCEPEVVQTVLDAGVLVDSRAMSPRVFSCRSRLSPGKALSTATLLLEHGARADARDPNGRTALHFGPDADVAKLLISHGADPNLRDEFGVPPLLATSDEDLAIALIEGGADVDAVAKNGRAQGHASGDTVDEIATSGGWMRVKTLVAARRARSPAT